MVSVGMTWCGSGVWFAWNSFYRRDMPLHGEMRLLGASSYVIYTYRSMITVYCCVNHNEVWFVG